MVNGYAHSQISKLPFIIKPDPVGLKFSLSKIHNMVVAMERASCKTNAIS